MILTKRLERVAKTAPLSRAVLSALRNRGENTALSVRAISAEKRGENQAHETDCPYGTGRSAPY